jgi:hypothetical protein
VQHRCECRLPAEPDLDHASGGSSWNNPPTK